MTTAFVGQGAKHAPHPVQAVPSTTGNGGPPFRGWKRIASASHCSPQIRHSVPFAAMQRRLKCAPSDQGRLSDRLSQPSPILSAPASQAFRQSPQKVQCPRLKLIWGRPAVTTIMPSGQALAHSSQRVHFVRKSASAKAHGGLTGAGRWAVRLRKERRETIATMSVPVQNKSFT